MIVTKNMKEKMMKATKLMGKKNVCAVIGAYKGTTYIRRNAISWLVNLPEGTSVGQGKPIPHQGMWTGVLNTREMTDEDILYTALMKL